MLRDHKVILNTKLSCAQIGFIFGLSLTSSSFLTVHSAAVYLPVLQTCIGLLIFLDMLCRVGRLELNGMKRRLTWEATPRSVHDGVAAAVASSDCLVFDANVARLFADTSGNLSINVTVTIC